MKITTAPSFNPLTITLETQLEVDMLSDALYELNLDEDTYTPEVISFIRDLRVDLYEHNSSNHP